VQHDDRGRVYAESPAAVGRLRKEHG
jgi:hypothetical protein